jgi:hypothetical protein
MNRAAETTVQTPMNRVAKTTVQTPQVRLTVAVAENLMGGKRQKC